MADVIIEARNLVKHFAIKIGFFKTLLAKKEVPVVHAVEDVSFEIKKKEVFGLVGESGCGKTTTGRTVLRLIEPTSGKVLFHGKDITLLPHDEMQKLRRKMQIIFQDPYESLSPRMSTYDQISEPMRIQNIANSEEEVEERVSKVMEEMGLVPPEEYLYRFPHELSGGQRQRVAIGRALILNPEFIVADEPVSMLDASIRTDVSKLMLKLVSAFDLSMLYITHDIALARYMCNRIAVMYLGKIVEKASTEDLIQKPLHPYTKALIAAVPVPDPTARRIEVTIGGQVPSPVNPPSGCMFHPRCPKAQEICREKEPPLIEVEKGRFVACHFPEEK